jgi:uncharacterized protein
VFAIVVLMMMAMTTTNSRVWCTGYYSRPWEWERIKANTSLIMQFGSTDDPFIPIDEMRTIATSLQSEYHEFTNQGHFQRSKFVQLWDALKPHLTTANQHS